MSAEDIGYDDYKLFPTRESAIDWLRFYLSADETDNLLKVLSAEPCEESAREWCKQNGYVMMRESVYEQDITKAYFEGQNIEHCDDCISRQAALDKAGYTETEEGWSGRTVDVKDIEALPPVTPKQKMGHWEWLTEDKYRCSNCNHETRVDECMNKPLYDFCPFCGAKMEEVDE